VVEDYSLRHCVQAGPLALPASYTMENWALFPPVVKRGGHGYDHYSPCNSGLKLLGAIPPFPPYVFMVLKYKNNITLFEYLNTHVLGNRRIYEFLN
jgi:hypothetical protein